MGQETLYAQTIPTKDNGTDTVTSLKRYQRKPPPRPPRPIKKTKAQSDDAGAAVQIKRERRLPPHLAAKKSADRNEKINTNKGHETRAKPIKNDRSVSANAPKKIETKYLRPSITTLFLQPKNANEKTVITRFKNLDPDSRFDTHNIQYNDLKSMSDIGNYVQAASNPIIAKWWGRDQQGNFNYTLVANRGAYTSTDADAITSRGSNTNRIEMIGEQLIDKSYVLVYEINDLYDMEEYYDRVDKGCISKIPPLFIIL